jgi:hypothetical protein
MSSNQEPLTTEGIIDKTFKVMDSFRDAVKTINLDTKYQPFEKKIRMNLLSSSHLWSSYFFNDAIIIERSCFELLILFHYLAMEPQEFERYEKDSELLNLINEYRKYKRKYPPNNFPSKKDIYKMHSNLSESTKEETTQYFDSINFNESKADKYVGGFKPLSQRFHTMMKKLKEKNFLNSKDLEYSAIFAYYLPSEYLHNSGDAIDKSHQNLGFSRDDEFALKNLQTRALNMLLYLNFTESLCKHLTRQEMSPAWRTDFDKLLSYINGVPTILAMHSKASLIDVVQINSHLIHPIRYD